MASRIYMGKSTGIFAMRMLAVMFCLTGASRAQSFDFSKLEPTVRDYSVIIEMKLEVSFGIHVNEQVDRYLGTVVSEDGLVIFNGIALGSDQALSSYSGLTVKTTPGTIDITTMDGRKYTGEFVGVDRYTKIGFLRIIDAEGEKFTTVKFKSQQDFTIGSWVGLYMLLPEFVQPPLAADIGMISSIVKSPEYFPLIVGFNALQTTSVLFNENLEPVGVLGALNDPTSAMVDGSGMLESFEQYGMPLLGVITGGRLEKLIADPPQKGKLDRGWLGITLQALTSDMSQFWGLDVPGGIIVNEIVRNSPADLAGLQVGDIIYEVDDQPVEVDKEDKVAVFQRSISDLGPGTAVKLAVLRRQANDVVDTLSLLATLQEAPLTATDAAEYENKALEFKVRDMVFGDYLYYHLDSESFRGVVVSELTQGGLADVEGLTIGDIIQRINNQPVSSIDDARTIMEELEIQKPGEIIFFVWRDNKTLFVNIKTDW